jgi:hypothetical protein
VTHVIQQQWHRENYLLLHISLWWVIIVLVLLHFAERPWGKAVATALVAREEWSQHNRLNVLCDGKATWFRDIISENLNEDMPTGAPLFRSVCLRMPDRWQLDRFETSIGSQTQTATFGGGESPCFELDFGEWEIGWRFSVICLKNASQDKLREFLQDLHRVLESTDGVTRVRWYHDAMLQGGQMTESDYALGITTPMESPTKGA